MATNHTGFVTIAPLLKRLATLESAKRVSAEELAAAVALTFTDSISPVQLGVLCWALHTTGQDHQPDVLSACAASMRAAAPQVDVSALKNVVASKALQAGAYGGGLVCWYAISHLAFRYG
nr:hypothetical protein CFP56_00869 [Quercus suber]